MAEKSYPIPDEPSTINDFDDSDYESSHCPLALAARIPNHFLLVALLERLVGAYEKDPARRRRMFHLICNHLDSIKVIPSWKFIDNFGSIHAQYGSLIDNMMEGFSRLMDHQQMPSSFLSVPSTSEERLQALLGIGDLRAPFIRSEDVFNRHDSRYKSEFIEMERIGKGGFGSVYKVKNKLDEKEYAVKKIKLKQAHPEFVRKVLREVQLLANLDHANIVAYNAAWIEVGPIFNPKTGLKTLLMDDTLPRKKCGPDVRYHKSNSYSRQYSSPPDLFGRHVTQSLPGDSFEKTLNKCALDDCQNASRTESMDQFGILGNAKCDADSEHSDLSIHFEDSPVQSKSVENRYFIERILTDTSFEIKCSELKQSEPCGNHISSDAPLFGSFGYNIAKTRMTNQLKDSKNCLNHEDSNLELLRDLSTGNRQDVAEQQKQIQKNAVVSFNQMFMYSLSHGSAGGLSRDHVFPGFVVTLYIQMELCSRTLAEWLVERNEQVKTVQGVNVTDNMRIFEGIMKGVHYIHSNGCIHRDLKPKNIFLKGDDCHVRIGDFGLARPDVVEHPLTPMDEISNNWDFATTSTVHTSGIGTTTYASPEQLRGSSYDSKSDMYSAGIILFEMFYPFTTFMERDICLKKLRQGCIAPEVLKSWPSQSKLIEVLVSANSMERPSADEVLHSELFVSKDEAMITKLQTKLSEQDKLLFQKQQQLWKQDEELMKANQQLKEKDALILELRKKLAPR